MQITTGTRFDVFAGTLLLKEMLSGQLEESHCVRQERLTTGGKKLQSVRNTFDSMAGRTHHSDNFVVGPDQLQTHHLQS